MALEDLYKSPYAKEYAANKRIAENSSAGSPEYEAVAKRNSELRNMYNISSDNLDYNRYAAGLAYANNKYSDIGKGVLSRLGNNTYSRESDRLYNQLKDFKYNPEADPTYKAYEKLYTRLGNQATNRVLSEATKLSGGRNNSWAVASATQAGQEYAGKVSDIIPQLAEQAYNRLYQQYVINNQRSDDEYNRNLNYGNTMYSIGNDEQNKSLQELMTGQNLDSNAASLRYQNLQNEAIAQQNDYNRIAYQQAIKNGEISIEQAAIDLAMGKINLEYLPEQLRQQIELTAAQIQQITANTRKLNGY